MSEYRARIKYFEPIDVDNALLAGLEIINGPPGQPHYAVFKGIKYDIHVVSIIEQTVTIFVDGLYFDVYLQRPIDILVAELGFDQRTGTNNKVIVAPMPGHVMRIMVTNGQSVSQNDILLTLEAMKMENTVLAASSGVVKEVFVGEGQTVTKGGKLIEFI